MIIPEPDLLLVSSAFQQHVSPTTTVSNVLPVMKAYKHRQSNSKGNNSPKITDEFEHHCSPDVQ